MSRRWLEDALRATGLKSGSQFPRDLMSDVVMQLPVSVEGLPSLSAHAVRNWLRERGAHHSVSDADRPLHGCLVARAGHGVVFLDAGDEEAERRFGNAVRRLRAERGLSQEGLALRCDIDRSYIGGVERGERNVSLVNIHRIAAALNVETAELLK